MATGKTFLRRAREGADKVHQARAAELVGLSRATLNAYEVGRVVPSERRVWKLLERLARGEPVQGERPKLLVAFSLFGLRFLSCGGRLLCFSEIRNAQWVADQLDECELESVVIWPAWPSAIEELVCARRAQGDSSAGVSEFETLGRPLEDVLAESLRAVAQEVAPVLERLSASAPTSGPKDAST